jgi:hypothetical protein
MLARGVQRYPDSMNMLDQQCAARYWVGKLEAAAKSCERALTTNGEVRATRALRRRIFRPSISALFGRRRRVS